MWIEQPERLARSCGEGGGVWTLARAAEGPARSIASVCSRRLCTKTRKPRHSGAPRRGEPGTHKHRPLEYGFRARRLRPRPGMTELFLQSPEGGRGASLAGETVRFAGSARHGFHDAVVATGDDVEAALREGLAQALRGEVFVRVRLDARAAKDRDSGHSVLLCACARFSELRRDRLVVQPLGQVVAAHRPTECSARRCCAVRRRGAGRCNPRHGKTNTWPRRDRRCIALRPEWALSISGPLPPFPRLACP